MLGDGFVFGGIWFIFVKKKICIFEFEIFLLCIDFYKYRRYLFCIFFGFFLDIFVMYKENLLVIVEMVNF